MENETKNEEFIELTEQEKIRKDRGFYAREFLHSDFFQKFLLPFIEKERFAEYPNPSETGWEEKYRLAYSKDAVFAKLLSDIKSWTNEYEDLSKKEKEFKKDINA